MLQLAVLLGILSCLATTALDLYPWGKYDFKEHSADLLDAMREYEHLKVWDSTISKSLQPEGSDRLVLKNSEGNAFELKIKDTNAVPFIDKHPARNNLTQIVAALQENCAVLIDGYWSYEWCHGTEVRQFHLEQKKEGFVRSPDWSLGKHTRMVTIREKHAEDNLAEAKERPVTKLIEYFEGGQRCDENRSKRSITVHTICCEGTKHKNFIAAEMYFNVNEGVQGEGSPLKGVKLPAATVATVEEPSTCKYEMTVCSPLMCPRPATIIPAASAHAIVSLKDSTIPQLAPIMKFVNHTCLNKQEDWWTYELCFNSGIRQVRYDLEQSITAEGKLVQKNTLVSQFQLGTAPLELYKNEAELKNRVMGQEAVGASPAELAIIHGAGMVTPTFRTRGREPRYISLDYAEGTPCDLDAVNRSTVVDLYCGPKNRLVSVWEESTCKYRAKVELAILCSFADFVPYKENTTVVEFVPYEDSVAGQDAASSDVVQTETKEPRELVRTSTETTATTTGAPSVEEPAVPDSVRMEAASRAEPVEMEVSAAGETRTAVADREARGNENHSEVAAEAESLPQTGNVEQPQRTEHAEHADHADHAEQGEQAEEINALLQEFRSQPDVEEELLAAEEAEEDELDARTTLSSDEQADPEYRYYIHDDLADLRLQYPDYDMLQFAMDFELAQFDGRLPWNLNRQDVEDMIEAAIAEQQQHMQEGGEEGFEGGEYDDAYEDEQLGATWAGGEFA